ncbi:MAG: 3-oxoacyl-ACP reductase FabG [Ignavibacteria bacterium]|nr:3-oxoacyl-ACP reductase FabG [Ignavibacteria bacterium]MBT8383029.1 3-oxoacyl-ACP reductase FabG [Ignavibacteria bacterium]MBT8391853.1 3-oxoacyl-ACP reductase FabG [Ignavibacteria bacterium]NNJ53979.1 3-oxoacyl-ACP reductase FabG [Ignavibacteriaceae bacterium]NNL21486.1 3-oxoacyl-ACP reductase FabG [Ignavibacteriaceae bacterium]
MITFKDKTVLITGGSRGIGKECVELFLNLDANVAFTYFTAEKSSNKILESYKGNSKLKSYQVNNSNAKEIEQSVKQIILDFETIDVLVNNAGIWKEASIEKMSIDEWNETLNINLTSAYLFSKFVVPKMKTNNFGRIINVASTAGQRGEAFHSHYAASKGGMISLTKSLAAELGEYGITVNSVAPGWVYTEMTKNSLEQKTCFEKVVGDIPLKKIAQPGEIAGPIIFLASDLASHITGEILNVNGGSVLCG